LSGPDVALVQLGIDDNAEPATVTATVISATAVPLTVATDVYLPASTGLLGADVQVFVKAALLAYINGADATEDAPAVPPLPIGGVDTGGGGKVPWRALVGVIEHATASGGDQPIVEATLTAETDIMLGVTDVATLIAGAITVTVHFI
jgi:hypothetical protein